MKNIFSKMVDYNSLSGKMVIFFRVYASHGSRSAAPLSEKVTHEKYIVYAFPNST